MSSGVAIVGMACRYPDARSPHELWENALAGRRAFRRIPDERLRAADYVTDDRSVTDATYVAEAAVLEGYTFDRARYRVAGTSYRAADLTHWLALDVAGDALADAGFTDGDGLPRVATGVLVGNSLTGEFSRASLMRLRWPYVRRVVDVELGGRGWSDSDRQTFLDDLELSYKDPFPVMGDESLAGGLSNTIAGRICNHFDLGGGGYTVDGACASSLLAVSRACTELVAGDVDVMLAGGVDLSLDPFELVGFARVGALASELMRVFDRSSSGFWPGEGCGMVVLMREEDAARDGRPVYAVLRGWGVSSDGAGGLTRPEVGGQTLALERAYRRAGFGIDTVDYFEGHGTGTAVGDDTEIRTLSRARVRSGARRVATIGSIKANIGHTKAAAGVAGLIKATLALRDGIVPPTTGCRVPHPAFAEEGDTLQVNDRPTVWPGDRPRRAAVSAMGFGGINAHVVLSAPGPATAQASIAVDPRLAWSTQDAELIILSAPDRAAMARRVADLAAYAGRLSRSDLIDLATRLAAEPAEDVRAAIVCDSPTALVEGLQLVSSWVDDGRTDAFERRAMFATTGMPPRIGFVFPGQGAPSYLGGGAWRRRFPTVASLYDGGLLAETGDGVATEVAQPSIMTATLGALEVCARLGLDAAIGVGLSLGELAAYHWAGVCDAEALVRIARARGGAMAEHGRSGGAMATVCASCDDVAALLEGDVVISGVNAPARTVVSGDVVAVDALIERARSRGWSGSRLRVSHAFHSSHVAAAASALHRELAGESFASPTRSVVSTITGTALGPGADLRSLLTEQLTSPVRFLEAIREADHHVDLWVEVGPGHSLAGLVEACVATPIVSLDASSASLEPLLTAVGTAFVRGVDLDMTALFADRFHRAFDLDWQPSFLSNPCESAPEDAARPLRNLESPADPIAIDMSAAVDTAGGSALTLVRTLAAQRAELPLSAVGPDDRLLGDLHLTSLAVTQLVTEAARQLDLDPPAAPTDAAAATVRQVAELLDSLAPAGSASDGLSRVAGVGTWGRAFESHLVPTQSPSTRQPERSTVESSWSLHGTRDSPMGAELESRLEALPGRGILVYFESEAESDSECVDVLLGFARQAIAEDVDHVVLADCGDAAAAFARSLALEQPELSVTVVSTHHEHAERVQTILDVCAHPSGYTEVVVDADGHWFEPRFRAIDLESGDGLPLGRDDVVLVTGGGKGIAAECALAIARRTGAALGLIGRSDPAADTALQGNLERFAHAGVRHVYARADVTDPVGVRAAVAAVRDAYGEPTAILHGAGRNVPQGIASLDRDAFAATLAPKVGGLECVLDAVDGAAIKMLVGFGSIIARTGLHGQADYAYANARLARRVDAWGATHPGCRCLTVEWSVWAGVGMGERLGAVDLLQQQGITALTIDQGLELLERICASRLESTRVVATGRFVPPRTLRLERLELPLFRFLEEPRVTVPGVELICDSRLSVDHDPYLAEHVLDGAPLLPAVVALEGMAQISMALAGSSTPPMFEEVEFERPVIIPDGGLTIRLAALRQDAGIVDVVLRSEETGFAVDHFRARCHFGRARMTPAAALLVDAERREALDPAADLYGGILFQSGRFQRLTGYRELSALHCVAEVAANGQLPWFGRYLPSELVLGDPAVRDAIIHSVQACIPHATVLPIGVERLEVLDTVHVDCVVAARERLRDGDTFVYDLDVSDREGRPIERWTGLKLRAVDTRADEITWTESLVGPYMERRLAELMPGYGVRVRLERATSVDSQVIIERLMGGPLVLDRRPDGRPDLGGNAGVSVSHAGDLTLVAAAEGHVACDAEPVLERSKTLWGDLIGASRADLVDRIVVESGESSDVAATRVWTAIECLRKAGAPAGAPIVLDTVTRDHWILLRSGGFRIATWVPQAGTVGTTSLAVLSGTGA